MILWHNPRCSKSRDTLALLQAQGHKPALRLYLIDPPSEQDLRDLLATLGMTASAFIRRKEPLFADLGLATTDDATLIRAMAKAPRLIERPVLIANGRAAIGRPPENVLSIL